MKRVMAGRTKHFLPCLLICGARDRAQKNGEDGEESSEPNLMDSLVPKKNIKFTDRQTDRKIGVIISKQRKILRIFVEN